MSEFPGRENALFDSRTQRQSQHERTLIGRRSAVSVLANDALLGGQVDFHMLTVLLISSRDTRHGLMTKSFFIFLSSAILFMQSFVLLKMGADLSYPSCREHEDCPQGTFCDKFLQNHICLDCWSEEERFYRCKELNELEYCEQGTNEYCLQTDTMDNKCDHIYQNMRVANFDSYVVIFFVILILGHFIVHEMEMAVKADRYLSKNAQNSILKQVFRCMLLGRRLGFPFIIAQGTVCAILMEPLGSNNILLNGLSIAFILEADDLFVGLLIPPATRDLILQLQSDLNDQILSNDDEIQDRRDWMIHRLTLIIAIPLIFMGIFRPEWMEFLLNAISGHGQKEDITQDCPIIFGNAIAIIFIGSTLCLILDVLEVVLRPTMTETVNAFIRSKRQELLLRFGSYGFIFSVIMFLIFYYGIAIRNNTWSGRVRMILYISMIVWFVFMSISWFIERKLNKEKVSSPAFDGEIPPNKCSSCLKPEHYWKNLRSVDDFKESWRENHDQDDLSDDLSFKTNTKQEQRSRDACASDMLFSDLSSSNKVINLHDGMIHSRFGVED